MMNYRLVKAETIKKMIDTFCNDDEYQTFCISLNQLSQELQYLALRMVRDPEKMSTSLLKQVFTFSMFCRDNMDLLQELINIVDYNVIDKEMVKNLKEEGELEENCD